MHENGAIELREDRPHVHENVSLSLVCAVEPLVVLWVIDSFAPVDGHVGSLDDQTPRHLDTFLHVVCHCCETLYLWVHGVVTVLGIQFRHQQLHCKKTLA